MRKAALVVAMAVTAGAGYFARDWWASRPVDRSKLTREQWIEDIDFLAATLAKKHKNAFHRISREQYERTVADVKAAVPGLPASEIPVEMLKITASVGDGHTYLQLPSSPRRYPVTVYWFGKDLRVIRAAAAFREALGARVRKIDGVDIGEVRARLHQIYSQSENEWGFMAAVRWLISRPEVLHALRIARDPGHAAFTLLDDSGKTWTQDMPVVEPEGVRWLEAFAKPPPWIEHRDEDFWFGTLPDSKTVYVIFNSYVSLRGHSRELFAFIDRCSIQRLILDLRENPGGDYTKGLRYLVEPIKARSDLNRRGHLFVITGRNTFSAAMNNAAHFHTMTNAILVGEPPGEVPNSYQEGKKFWLPNSHLMVQYSSEYYRFLDQDVFALVPDKEIDPDWPNYREGRDPALEWIAAQPLEP